MTDMKTIPSIALGLILAAGAITVFAPSPANAQATQLVCLSHVTVEPPVNEVSLAVAPEFVAALQAKGFTVEACEGEEMQRAALHDDVCRLADIAPPKVLARFAERFGAEASELCAATAPGPGE